MGFGGTISLRSGTMIRLLRDVVASLHRHGARRVVFLNWHERNQPAMEIAAEDAQNAHEDLRILIVHAHFIARDMYGGKAGLTHGGELEILPVLADRPELVHLDRAADPSPIGRAAESDAARRDHAVYFIPKDVREMYETGWYGLIEDASPARAAEVMEGVSQEAARRIKAHFGMG